MDGWKEKKASRQTKGKEGVKKIKTPRDQDKNPILLVKVITYAD